MTATQRIAHAQPARAANTRKGGEHTLIGHDVTRPDATHRRPGGSASSGRRGGTVEAMPATSRQTTPATVDTAPAMLDTATPVIVDTLPHVAAVADALTPAEVAELLRVDVYTVRRWITQGALPAYRIGRSLRIAPATLDAFVANQLVRA